MNSESAIAEHIARRFRSRWLRGYAGGKLRTDPVYRASFERIGGVRWPLLDIGCGTGLHAFYLRERGFAEEILGIDVDAEKIAAGSAVAAAHYNGIKLRVGEGADLPEFRGSVSMLDVLHYFPREAQALVLKQMAERIAPGAWCVIRTTPADWSWRFRLTQLEEQFTRVIGWMSRPALAFPTLESIAACFSSREFEHDIQPLWGRTPFNSWLLAFRRR